MNNKNEYYYKSAIKGCDWLVNNQIRETKPNYDANLGRIPYHIHIPSGYKTMGLCWTMARSVMCLLSAYKETKDNKYKETAEFAINYNKTLQILDKRNKNFGAICEETPFSKYCYPRDGSEVADAFLMWYRETNDKDSMERACFFLDWYLKYAYIENKKLKKWAIPEIRLDQKQPRLKGFHAYQAGAGRIFYNAYLLTNKTKYKTACINYAVASINNFMTVNPKNNSFLEHNDDGMAVSILCAYNLTKNEDFLNACIKKMDYYRNNGYPENGSFAGLPCILNIMLEIDNITGESRYLNSAKVLAKQLVSMQVKKGPKSIRGAFIGEDEPAENYVKKSKGNEFVCTRTTAYAVLSLFKMANKDTFGYTANLTKK